MRALLRRWLSRGRVAWYNTRPGNHIAPNCHIDPHVELLHSTLADHAVIAHHASVKFTRLGRYSGIGRYSKVTHTEIGAFCAISWDVTINAIEHPYTHLSIHAFPYVPSAGGFVERRTQEHQPVIIGSDVWVGANAVIMPGVRIGDGAIIGAGAVVTRDVPPYAIVGGVPAKLIKYRFDEAIIERLLRLRWWEWDNALLKANIRLFQKDLTPTDLDELELLCSKS